VKIKGKSLDMIRLEISAGHIVITGYWWLQSTALRWQYVAVRQTSRIATFFLSSSVQP